MSRTVTWFRQVFISLALLVAGATAAPGARAQADGDAEARSYFDAGRAAYAEGDFERALDYFERSYQLSQKPMLLYNVGMALDRLRRDEEAIAAYEGYLQAIPGAENRPAVERRLVLLRQSVAKARAESQAPSAAETARAGAVQSTPTLPAADRPQSAPVYRKWWFWTSIGAAVVGGVVAAVIVSQPDSASDGAPRGVVRL